MSTAAPTIRDIAMMQIRIAQEDLIEQVVAKLDAGNEGAAVERLAVVIRQLEAARRLITG